MERTVKIVLGDWSWDGHNQTETVNVKISGEDVSDATLARNYAAMADQVVDLGDIVSNYEEFTVSPELYEQLFEAGFVSDFDPENYHDDAAIRVESALDEEGEEVTFGAVELVMFYVGHSIPNFTWEVERNGAPLLIGGRNSIVTQRDRHGADKLDSQGNNITSFGYGLFT